MKHLKIFESYLSEEEISEFCNKCGSISYSIDKDKDGYYVNVQGNVDMAEMDLLSIPIRFVRISGGFYCGNNKLITLENCPRYVGKNFYCEGNKNLTTLRGGPEYVGGLYNCSDNNLKDVYGFPESFRGGVAILGNPVEEILAVVKKFYKYRPTDKYARFLCLLNDNHVIRNGDTIIENRLEEALYGIGVEIDMENLEFKNYKLV